MQVELCCLDWIVSVLGEAEKVIRGGSEIRAEPGMPRALRSVSISKDRARESQTCSVPTAPRRR